MDILEQFLCAAAAVHRTMEPEQLCMQFLGLKKNRDIIALQAEAADLLNNFRLQHEGKGHVLVRFARSVPEGELSTDPIHEKFLSDKGEYLVPMNPQVFLGFFNLNMPQMAGGQNT